jgi:hypothetical protein
MIHIIKLHRERVDNFKEQVINSRMTVLTGEFPMNMRYMLTGIRVTILWNLIC